MVFEISVDLVPKTIEKVCKVPGAERIVDNWLILVLYNTS